MFSATRFLTLKCAFTLLLASALTACSGGAKSSQPLVSISLTPGSPSVAAGLTQQFKATGTYSDSSTADVTSSVIWSSGTISVATMNGSGLATSKTQGTSTITATSGSIQGSTTLTVTAPKLVSISVSPANATAQVGASSPQQFSALGTYTDESVKDVSSSVTWTVTNPWVASIGSTGAASASRSGYTAITALTGALSATANFAVLAAPRFLYVASEFGRDLTRMAVNANTGQPQFLGYQQTGNFTNIGPSCLTMDPAGERAYLASQVLASSGSGYTGLINVYTINAATGQLTSYPGNPFPVAEPVGCINFEPGGKFAYAVTPIGNSGNALATFSVNSDGTLTLADSITLPGAPGGLVIDPLGKFLYVPTISTAVGQTAYAYGYSIDPSTGGLTAIAGMPFVLPAESDDSFSFHPSGNYVYFADFSNGSISEYTINRTTGLLSAASAAMVSPCINPSAPQFSPDGAHAYISCEEDSNRNPAKAPLISFSVGSDGTLTQIGVVSAGISSSQMIVDPSGKFLYVLGSGSDYTSPSSGSYNVAGNVVMVYQLGTDGTPTLVNQIAGRVLEDSMLLVGGTNAVSLSPTYAYVSSSGDNKLTSYAVQPDGSLNLLQSSTTAVTPISATMLAWGSDLLLASTAASPNLEAYAISNGTLATGSSFGLATQSGGIAIDPAGRIAFGSDSATGLIYEYGYGNFPGFWSTVYDDPSGTPLTYTAQAGAGPVITDPAGRYLIVANQTAKSISLFEYAGAPAISPIALAYTPLAIAMDPTGNLLFVGGDDLKLHLLISNGLGLLTDSSDAALAGSSSSVAVEPGGHFVYAAGAAGLSAFSVDQTKHALAPITLSLPVSLANATGVFIDPSGQFLYVSVTTSSLNAMYRFSINTDGTVSATSTAPVALPNHATSMVFSEQIQ
jgi:6-phosphogluconolactonase (cycloisomerase 2 family)